MTRRCSTCSNDLHRSTRGDYCLSCLRAQVVERLCTTCKTPISEGSRTGKCFTCYQAGRSFTPPPPTRIWCGQCERNVFTAEAAGCTSQWCKAKAVAA